MTPPPATPSRDPGFAADIVAALRFFSRLTIPKLPWEADAHAAPDFARAARAVPLAGALLGAIGAAVLALAVLLGLPAILTAILAVAALVLVTGALHEDGLADTADGFGGGATRERKLDIMKDSRIGSYGAVALVLALTTRIAVIAEILTRLGFLSASAALVAAAALSRLAALWLPYRLPPARSDGAAVAAGAPSDLAFVQASLSAAAIALAILWPITGLGSALGGLLAGLGIAVGMAYLSRRQIGGQTGDVAGATQQLADIAILVSILVLHR